MKLKSRCLERTRVLTLPARKPQAGCPLPLADGLPSVRSRQSVHAVAWLSVRYILEHQDVRSHPSPVMPSLPAVDHFRNDDQIALGGETRFG
jgi:hypothetical protein